MAAAGMVFGLVLLILALTGLIDWLARFFTKPIMRGIQLGLGLILMHKGISFITKQTLFIQQTGPAFSFAGLSPFVLKHTLSCSTRTRHSRDWDRNTFRLIQQCKLHIRSNAGTPL